MAQNYEDMASQVAMATLCRIEDARDDVRHTGSVQRSVDRFVAGNFLEGVVRGGRNAIVNKESMATPITRRHPAIDIITIDDSPVTISDSPVCTSTAGTVGKALGDEIIEYLSSNDESEMDIADPMARPMPSSDSIQEATLTADSQTLAPSMMPRSPPVAPRIDSVSSTRTNQAYDHAPHIGRPLCLDSNTSLNNIKRKPRQLSDSDSDLDDIDSLFSKFAEARKSRPSPAAGRQNWTASRSQSQQENRPIMAVGRTMSSASTHSMPLERSTSLNLPNFEVEDLIETSTSSPIGETKRKRFNESPKPEKGFSESTKALLQRLDSFDLSKYKGIQKENKRIFEHDSQKTDIDDVEGSDTSSPKNSFKKTQLGKSKRAPKKGAEGDLKSAREKEKQREQKRLEKEQKAAEKEREKEIAAVNKLKTSKKDSCTEMIVDIDMNFAKSACGAQLQSLLTPLGIEVSTSWISPTGNMIKWRRKVIAEYNEALDQFMPIPEEIRKENFIMIVLSGVEFVDMVIENRVEENIILVQRLYPDLRIVYMIEGLSIFLRKMAKQTRREFDMMVQDAMGGATSKARNSESKEGDLFAKVQAAYNHNAHREMVEDAIITLQVAHSCLIFHSNSPSDSAEWIAIMTQDISTIPYKKARLNLHETICMEAGQIKAGADHVDTFHQTMQQIKYVTPGLCKDISDRYKNIDGMMRSLSLRGADTFMALREVEQPASQTARRRIGQTLSNTLHFIFSATDPNALVSQKDGMVG